MYYRENKRVTPAGIRLFRCIIRLFGHETRLLNERNTLLAINVLLLRVYNDRTMISRHGGTEGTFIEEKMYNTFFDSFEYSLSYFLRL